MAQTDAMRRFGWGDAKQASGDPSASDCLNGVDVTRLEKWLATARL